MIKIAWHPIYVHPVPKTHRFPMDKYDLLPTQLKREGIVEEGNFFEPSLDHRYSFDIHQKEYLDRLYAVQLSKQEERASGFKQSKLLVEREICITNGTIEGAISAIEAGLAFNIAGGTHHAFSDKPEGFCLLNDQAIAAMHLLQNGLAKKILIVDLDVHQGNGTAEILQDEDRVFTFSMHGKNNYPMKKPASNLDIALEDDISDDSYLEILKEKLPELYHQVQPDFTFFQAGVDVLASDKLGRLSLTLEGCRKRDELAFATAKQFNNPVMVTMGGGYSPDLSIILEAHCNTFRTGLEVMDKS